jgi:hypothetical protein
MLCGYPRAVVLKTLKSPSSLFELGYHGSAWVYATVVLDPDRIFICTRVVRSSEYSFPWAPSSNPQQARIQ